MKVILLDADILLYKYAFRNTFSVDFDEAFQDEQILTFCDREVAIAEMCDFVTYLENKLGTTDTIWCLSDSSNFRYDLYKDYKANRNMSTVPTLKNVLKDWIKKNCKYLQMKNLEADDVMGLMSTDDTIIATIDKDLDTIPGLHYNWDKDVLYDVSLEEADRFFYTQVLMGDSTDNIRGAPKIGKVKANRFMDDDHEDLWSDIVDLYHKQMVRHVNPEVTYEEAYEEALLNARLVRILRPGESIEEPWEPTT
jgi:DNA polymerase-1